MHIVTERPIPDVLHTTSPPARRPCPRPGR
jgi:hypothetical protein